MVDGIAAGTVVGPADGNQVFHLVYIDYDILLKLYFLSAFQKCISDLNIGVYVMRNDSKISEINAKNRYIQHNIHTFSNFLKNSIGWSSGWPSSSSSGKIQSDYNLIESVLSQC